MIRIVPDCNSLYTEKQFQDLVGKYERDGWYQKRKGKDWYYVEKIGLHYHVMSYYSFNPRPNIIALANAPMGG